MVITKETIATKYRGTALIMAMILIAVSTTLAVSLAAMSNGNVQLASNQHKIGSALSAAQSGIECSKYLITTLKLPSTNRNVISKQEADEVWTVLCRQLQKTAFNGQNVPSATRFKDAAGSGDQISTVPLNYDGVNDFTLRLFRYDSDPNIIKIRSTGICGETIKRINMDTRIARESKILNYAVAGRGRMWVTGKSTIHGDIFSAWNRPDTSPFSMSKDSSVLGTINTVLTLDQVQNQSYQLETLNADEKPVDGSWRLLGCNYRERYISENDRVKAYHEGINYGQVNNDLPGMKASDYNTEIYNTGLIDIAPCPSLEREVEYFPHAPGNYNYPREGTPYNTSNLRLSRHVYENQTFKNSRLPSNRNALFRNCTFEEVLYINCNKNANSYFNNVRFENCTFRGVIVTNVPQSLKWLENCLYFTGEATFKNTSSIKEATILAPNFNVNLGNTNPRQGESNILTGAIIGGIVDIRCDAQIFGTIISMCDTTRWKSGFVTNIGATLNDGGSETTELGDIGIINITPDKNQILPSGITTPIVLKTLKGTYSEG